MKSIYRLLFALGFVLAQVFTASAQTASAASQPAKPAQSRKVDKAAAYYHYALAHMYEEQIGYGRSDLVSKAIEEYRLAIEADPNSQYLTSGLAELYYKTGRIHDAVVEVQDILKSDPGNLDAHKLLGRFYLRSLGDVQSGNGSASVLKLAIEQYEQIIKIEPNNVDNHLLLGRLYRLGNDSLKAENEFKFAMKLDPDSEEAATTLAYLYNEEGDTTRAAQILSSIPDSSRSAKLYSALGYTYEQQKQYKNAVNAYKHAVELDRDNLDAVRGLAQNLLNDGQIDAALEQYKAVVGDNPEDAQTYVRMAEIYRRQGKLDLALDSLKQAASKVQDSIEVPYSLAAIYQTQGRYNDAIQVMQDLLKKTEKPVGNYTSEERTNRGVFLERLGSIYHDSGNDTLALETFRKILALGDDNAKNAYQQIIDVYREAKEWQKATDTAKEATQKLPDDRDMKMIYAALLADMGQAETGLQQVKALLQGNPKDRQVYIALAQMYTRLRRWPEAEEALDKAEQFSTRDEEKQSVSYLRGANYERQKKYDQAEEVFRKILASDSQYAPALNYLGYMLADRGVKLEEALGFIKKAVDMDPSDGAYLDSLGWAYFRLGKFELAEENLVKASQHIGADATVQDHLGDLYQKTGRLKLAAAHWERALNEWNRTVAAEVDPADVAKVQKKLESAKVKLAQENPGQK